MEAIEQLVYASGDGQPGEGSRRVVASPGLSEADVAEVLAWEPQPEAILPAGAEPTCLHFHPLPSGASAIGRTTCPARRPGARGGLKAVVQCLVVPPRTLARFANNPFALLRAAQAGGMPHELEELPCRLDALRLEGRTPIIDAALLRQLRLYPGPEWMAAVVHAALDSPNTAIVGSLQMEHLLAGVISCLPPECRTAMSFSIGLRFSSRRPYRLVAMSHDADEQQRMARLYNVPMLDLGSRPPAEFAPIGSWGRLVHRVLRTGRVSFFAGQLARRPLDFSPRDLPALGLQLLEELDASACEEENPAAGPTAGEAPSGHCDESQSNSPESGDQHAPAAQPPAGDGTPDKRHTRAHVPHPPLHLASEASVAAAARAAPPSQQIQTTDPVMLERLERLDDLVFEAISGNHDSLGQLKSFWPQVHSELDGHLLAESREQYLRYALASWEELAQRDGVRNPAMAMQSLEVLCVLFGDAH
jgi:hypothetical protein